MPVELPELPSNFQLAEVTKAAFMRMTSFQLRGRYVRTRYEIENSQYKFPPGTIATIWKKFGGLELRFQVEHATIYIRHIDFYAVDLLDEIISKAEDLPQPKLKLTEIQ